MCARITQQLSPNRIGELNGVRTIPLSPDQPPRYNGAPGEDFSVCRFEEHGAYVIVRGHGGLIPSWARDARTDSRLINHRGDRRRWRRQQSRGPSS